MNIFVENFSHVAYTENGALSYATTGCARVDLFFKTVRNIDEGLLTFLLEKSWCEDPTDTLKLIFQSRDCRGGKGERTLFHQAIRWLAENHPEAFWQNLEHIPEYGTWKDLLDLACLYPEAIKVLAKQLQKDYQNMLEGKPITLACKWAPTEGCAHDNKWGAVTKLAKILGLTKGEYRKQLTQMRAYIQVVEQYVCSRRWHEIEYQKVPSVAMFRLRKAFSRHDGERFKGYLEAVKAGTAKINASQLFPHQLVGYYLKGGEYDTVIELQWLALVQQIQELGTLKGIIPICDVSGSMSGQPLKVSIALGLLISQVAEDEFKDMVITFSEVPQFHQVRGKTLQEKVYSLQKAPWGGRTNIERVFQLILQRAIALGLPQEKMPKRIICLSDMEFDQASSGKTNFEQIKTMYTGYEYDLPQLIFWNLASRTLQFPAPEGDNVALISGFSPSILQALIEDGEITPYLMMRKVIDSPRYAKITVSLPPI